MAENFNYKVGTKSRNYKVGKLFLQRKIFLQTFKISKVLFYKDIFETNFWNILVGGGYHCMGPEQMGQMSKFAGAS